MGVKIKKRGGKWYVFVNYHGRRKAKCIGSTRQLAEQVKRQLEAKLALGDFGFLGQDEKQAPLFRDYAKNWLSGYVELECKPSTAYSYAQLLRLHVTPRFGDRRLAEITRDDVKQFLSDLSQATRFVKEIEVPRFSKNTLRLVVCALRAGDERRGRGRASRSESRLESRQVYQKRETSPPGQRDVAD